MKNVKVMVKVGNEWTVYAEIPARFAELYVRYAMSRGFKEVVVV